jgi:hypothetical protein
MNITARAEGTLRQTRVCPWFVDFVTPDVCLVKSTVQSDRLCLCTLPERSRNHAMHRRSSKCLWKGKGLSPSAEFTFIAGRHHTPLEETNLCVATEWTAHVQVYGAVSKSFRTESITKYMLTKINTREATQRVMPTKLTRPTHKIAIQLHPVVENCTTCSSRSGRPVRKLLDTPA